ncbi:MAG: AsmA family protein [Sedimentisphaerales bacterium]|nr:AsmA family protein [Sedimentisphaerales bacterium]
MTKNLKIPRLIVLVILVLTAAIVIVVNLFADRAVKAGIESTATEALKVEVSVSDVDLSIVSGKLVLQNFSIGNPPAYQHDKLLVLRNTEIEIEAKSLLSDVVNIRQIRIDHVDVTIEQLSVSENNLHDVVQAASEITDEWKKLRIDNLEISEITVKVDLMTDTEQTEPVTLALSPIRMTNLGRDNKMDIAALLKEIILAIADSVVEEGIGVLPADIVGSMTSTLSKTINLGTRIMEGKEDIGREITEGLRNLLKSGAEKEE